MHIEWATGTFSFLAHPIKVKNNFGQNIGMWGVYPEVLGWKVGAVQSEFGLDAPISRKSPKTFKI